MPLDHDLMLDVRNGDIGKMGMLFEKYHKQLYNFFLLCTRNCQLSEDMVQDVFFRMLKYRHTYRNEGSFITWMFKIARNVRIDYFKEDKIQSQLLEITDEIASGEPNPEELCGYENEVALLQKAIAELPDDKREVILMSRFNNMSYKEIGSVLDCSVGTVKVRVYRAVRELTKIYYKLTGEKCHEM